MNHIYDEVPSRFMSFFFLNLNSNNNGSNVKDSNPIEIVVCVFW